LPAAYLINTSSKHSASLTLNGYDAGSAPAASYDVSTKIHFTEQTVNGEFAPTINAGPGTDNVITLWGRTYYVPLPGIPNTGENLWLFFFANQLIVVGSFSGVILVVPPNSETSRPPVPNPDELD
jgi:hypothetical protein